MGKLILFPVPIGAENPDSSLPPYNRELLNTCYTFIVEDTRTARRNLKRMGYIHPIDSVTFFELNEHTPPNNISNYLDNIDNDENIGLMSEAGLPCIADPGNLITSMAQQRGIEIVPLVGPSSIFLALMASGFNGQNFAFNGYPPINNESRMALLRTIEQLIHRDNQTQIFIEAPYRNDKLLHFIKSKLARQWLNDPPPLHKRPTIFLLYK